MSWLTESGVLFVAAAALATLGAGCGHPPLTAYATPHPIMLGPVRRLPGGGQAMGQHANDIDAGSFTATASTRLQVTATPTPGGGSYTTSTEVESLSSVLDAAAIDAIQGDARGRLEAREVTCSSVVIYALFYVLSEEQCTLTGRTERPRPALPQAPPAGVLVPNAALAAPSRVSFPERTAPASTTAIGAARE